MNRQTETMGRVLIVDHETELSRAFAASPQQEQYRVSHAGTVAEARQLIRTGQYDAVLTAHALTDGRDIDILEEAQAVDPALAVVFVNGQPTADWVLESARKGAFDLLGNPAMPEVLQAAVRRACQNTVLRREYALLKSKLGAGDRAAGAAVAPAGSASPHAEWIEGLPSSFDLRALLSTLEKTLIERTLQATRGAQAEAARRLGLSRSDLSYKLLKYELRKETAAS
jgi:DNA-binding NtrC family response regulator